VRASLGASTGTSGTRQGAPAGGLHIGKIEIHQQPGEDAEALARKVKRGTYEFEFAMAYGDAGIEPNNRVTLEGWDSEIDGVKWLVSEGSHTLDGSAGLHGTFRLVSVDG